jgi:hypothetical protein
MQLSKSNNILSKLFLCLTLSLCPVTVTIERKDDSFWVQNDQPRLLRIPKAPYFIPGKMTIFTDGEITAQRYGKSSRFNSEQFEYRLDKANDRVVIDPAE